MEDIMDTDKAKRAGTDLRVKKFVVRQGARRAAHPLLLPLEVCFYSILLRACQYFLRIKSVYGTLLFYVKSLEHKSQYIALFSHTPFKRTKRARGFK
jgi:hypothetical protein